jgi:hypothetical protein
MPRCPLPLLSALQSLFWGEPRFGQRSLPFAISSSSATESGEVDALAFGPRIGCFCHCYCAFGRDDAALVLVWPETVIRWHRRWFRLYWRWKSRSRHPGRPTIEAELRDLSGNAAPCLASLLPVGGGLKERRPYAAIASTRAPPGQATHRTRVGVTYTHRPCGLTPAIPLRKDLDVVHASRWAASRRRRGGPSPITQSQSSHLPIA